MPTDAQASTPLIVLVLMYVARIETPSCSVLCSAVVIGAPTETRRMVPGGIVRLQPPSPMVAGLGTLVAAHGEVRFVWRGVLAMTASQFTEASKLVPSCVDMESHRVPQPCRASGHACRPPAYRTR
jgi:hypothetical protein